MHRLGLRQLRTAIAAVPPEQAQAIHLRIPDYTDDEHFPEPHQYDYHREARSVPEGLDSAPLVIDLGSFHCRAGWSLQDSPTIDFRSVVRKCRYKRKFGWTVDDDVVIGNKKLSLGEQARVPARSPWDGTILTDQPLTETMMDYVFASLGFPHTSTSIEHPLMFTEQICNPNFCRGLLSELAFECYGVPSLCYGVDSLFSWFYNSRVVEQDLNLDARNALILATGFRSTHIIPIIGGVPDLRGCRRVPLGGAHITKHLEQTLKLKFPVHKAFVTAPRARYLKEHYCYVAEDFTSELQQLYSRTDPETVEKLRIVQLDIPVQPEAAVQSAEELERRKAAKQEHMRKLQAASQAKRQQIRQQHEDDLAELKELQAIRFTDPKKYQARLALAGYMNEKAVDRAIGKLEAKLARGEVSIDDIPETEEELLKEFPLLNVPDSELNEEERAEKKKQRFVHSTKLARYRQRQRRAQHQAAREAQLLIEEEKRLEDPTKWLADLYTRRQEVIDRIEKRRKAQEVGKSSGSRRTKQQQERLRLMNLHAMGSDVDESFGADDKDWDVYVTMAGQNEQLEEEEEDEAALKEIDELLQQHDADNLRADAEAQKQAIYQLHIATERCRAPEVLFQPSMLGMSQAGVIETSDFVLHTYKEPERLAMTQDVFLTGGSCFLPGFSARIESELRSLRPFDAPLRVRLASNPSLDAWRGAAKWIQLYPQEFQAALVSKAEYDEHGAAFFKTHRWSNYYFQPEALE